MLKTHRQTGKKTEGSLVPRSKAQAKNDLERAGRLREVMEALYEANKKVPVIVEGRKDAKALRALGLIGEIITLHSGNNLYEFCEDILDRFAKVILLMDWDDKGESLSKTLKTHLNGAGEGYSGFRDLLKILCRKDIKDIESIPKLIETLEDNETPRQ